MQAVQVSIPGGPEQLHALEVARPKPEPGEILVRTHTVGVNFIETYQRSGVYSVPLPFTPGSEASGFVEAIGDGVTNVSIGDAVTTALGARCYAEFFTVAADLVAAVPAEMPMDIAGALPLQGLTAHYLSTSIAPPERGDTVVVHAGAGGVGLLLTQLLSARGVRVITTVSTPEKAELSRNAGAAAVAGYDDFRERALELSGGIGVPVVYDGVGATTFDESLACLKPRGTLVLFGASSGPVPPFDLQRLAAGGSLSITRPRLGHFMATPEERQWRYGELFAVASGVLDVRIGGRFPLNEASAAHAALESRATTGKLVLEVGS